MSKAQAIHDALMNFYAGQHAADETLNVIRADAGSQDTPSLMLEHRTMSKAQAIHDERFSTGTPRSAEYKAGALYMLRRLFEECPTQTCPYTPGTASADAWFAGCDGAQVLWHVAKDEELHG